MTPAEISERPEAAGDRRDQFIPVRKRDIVDALCAQRTFADEAAHDQFRQLSRLLGSIFHYEYFDQLERVRDDYFYFNPELDPRARLDADQLDRTYRDLLEVFIKVLNGANFIEVSHAEVERALREQAVVRVNIKVPVDDYRDIRFFRRRRHKEKFTVEKWFGLRKRETEVEVYDDVVLWVAIKDHEETAEKLAKRVQRQKVRPGCALIKYFRHIAGADLNALFPDVQVVMGLRDKLFLGVLAVVGGLPILFKLASSITVLFLVAGF